MLITFTREYGAGGSSVARLVANRLGWHLVDNELVDEVARRAGVTREEVKEKEERGPTFVERVARALAAATPELFGQTAVDVPEAEEARLVRVTEEVVREAASDHAVLVGRAAVAVIGERSGTLHVRLVAEMDFRAKVIVDRDGLSREDAERRIREMDAHRARYHRQWYRRDWSDAHHYDLTLNTGWLGLERSADVVIAAVPEQERK